jgi:hypothetical protein
VARLADPNHIIDWAATIYDARQRWEQAMSTDPNDLLPSAKDCMKKIAEAEAEKASEYMRRQGGRKASADGAIRETVRRLRRGEAQARGSHHTTGREQRDDGGSGHSVPNTLRTDDGRAINQMEPGWENTLTGLPKDQFWDAHLRPRGYRLRCQIID